MTRTRRVFLIGTASGAAALLAACGSSEKEDAQEPEATPAADPADEETPAQEAEPSEEGGESEDTAAGAAEAEMIPVPDGGPEGVAEFPIPAGTEISDLGAFSGNWQFTVLTEDAESVVSFYRTVLPEHGFTVVEDAQGVNVDLVFDLAFEGPCFGVVRVADLMGGVDVQLDEEVMATA
ncbi:hypothetical protein [Brachybacterium hainanense]|uniref:Uncharacterized protein n=1 Tax=Brachybacterium hainanense TaxID=1541174 RepID=A0ABV6R737_9MICO